MAYSLAIPPSNFQLQSPLFGVLPPEIRNNIFALVLLPYEDDAARYAEDSYWYRPGFFAPHKSTSTLLATCKLAYAEGQKVFLRGLEWAFWLDRGPAGRSGNLACTSFIRNLAPQAVRTLQKYRFFTQMYWLERGDNLRMLMAEPKFRPVQLTITIRYSDWWFWEGNAPLRMDDRWLRNFLGNPGLRQLRVEYETLNWKKEEMMRIIERNKKLKLPVQSKDGSTGYKGYLIAEGVALAEWTWKGTSKLGGCTWDHHGTADQVEYVVVIDTWKFVESKKQPSRKSKEGKESTQK